jgi:hypothetical protein
MSDREDFDNECNGSDPGVTKEIATSSCKTKKKAAKKRKCPERGLSLSPRDLLLLKFIRNATFVTRVQTQSLAPFVGIKFEDNKNLNRRLRRLVKYGLLIVGKPAAPFAGSVYSISHMGLGSLERNGEYLASISSGSDTLAVANQLIHALMLNEVRLAWSISSQKSKPSEPIDWLEDRIIRAMNSYERVHANYFDAIVNNGYILGFEYENHLKNKEACKRIADALDRETQVNAVLYLTNSPEESLELLRRIRTRKFPIAALTVSEFVRARGKVTDLMVLCQASEDGPIWKCTLNIFLCFFEELPRLHLDKSLWKLHIGAGMFEKYRD